MRYNVFALTRCYVTPYDKTKVLFFISGSSFYEKKVLEFLMGNITAGLKMVQKSLVEISANSVWCARWIFCYILLMFFSKNKQQHEYQQGKQQNTQ